MISLETIEVSEENRTVAIKRNRNKQVTEIKIYRALFSDLKKQFSIEHDCASILVLSDLRTSQFWWQYTGERNDNLYLKQDIDTCLSRLGYWEEENGIYIYYNSVRNLKKYLYLSKYRIVQFHIRLATLYITEAQEHHEEFVQSYNKTIFKITEQLEKEKQVNDRSKAISLARYIDDRFFRIPNFCGIACGIADVGELIEVTRQDDKWMVELVGVDWEESDRTTKALYVRDWLAEWQEGYHKTKVTIILNDNYEVVDILGEYFVKKKIRLIDPFL